MPIEKSSSRDPAPSRLHLAGYEMPEGDDGLIPWSWARHRLEVSHNYWLATTRPDGRPHLMVIWGLWLSGVFYFSTASGSRKALNLQSNAHCVIGTEQSDEAVVVEGVAEKLRDVKQLEKLLQLYEKKYGEVAAMRKDILELRDPIFSVRPKTAFGLDEKMIAENATRWRFAT